MLTIKISPSQFASLVEDITTNNFGIARLGEDCVEIMNSKFVVDPLLTAAGPYLQRDALAQMATYEVRPRTQYTDWWRNPNA